MTPITQASTDNWIPPFLKSLLNQVDTFTLTNTPSNSIQGEQHAIVFAIAAFLLLVGIYQLLGLINPSKKSYASKKRNIFTVIAIAGISSASLWGVFTICLMGLKIPLEVYYNPAWAFGGLSFSTILCTLMAIAIVKEKTPHPFIAGMLFSFATCITVLFSLKGYTVDATIHLNGLTAICALILPGVALALTLMAGQRFKQTIILRLSLATAVALTITLAYGLLLNATTFIPWANCRMGENPAMVAACVTALVILLLSQAVVFFYNSGGGLRQSAEAVDIPSPSLRETGLKPYIAIIISITVGITLSVAVYIYMNMVSHSEMEDRFISNANRSTKEINRRLNIMAARNINDKAIAIQLINEVIRDNYHRGLMMKVTDVATTIAPVEITIQQSADSYREFIPHIQNSWRVDITPRPGFVKQNIWPKLAGLLTCLLLTSVITGYLFTLLRQRHYDTVIQKRLRQAKIDAEQASKSKSEFLATMSHEIRTPMNGVFGMLDLLLRSKLNPDQEDLAQTARRSAENLQGILNDILDFSKIEQGALELESNTFNLRFIAEDCIDVFATVAAKKHLNLILRYAPNTAEYVVGDGGRIRQVLNNLVGNALKFTTRGHVLVNIDTVTTEADKTTLRFAVEDSGIGISEEGRKKLFERFSQVDASTTRRFGGTGLGLAICKRLVELMGGNVNVDSVEGQGSTFWFTLTLPLGTPPANLAEEHRVATLDLQGTKILLVEDDLIAARVVRETIESLGASCYVARTIENGWAELNANPSDTYRIVIVDQKLPDGMGFELGKRIRSDSRFANTKLLSCSSLDLEHNANLFAEIGFNGYLIKPIRQNIFESMLLNMIHNKNPNVMLTRNHLREKRETSQNTTPGMKSTRVLIVEDDRVNQKVASRFVNLLGGEAFLADNGALAIEIIERGEHYDIIFMDMRMPVMDGIEATWRIRELEVKLNIPRTPIIALTANASQEDIDTCRDSGMDDFLSKPMSLEKFKACLSKWIDKKSDELKA